MSPKCRGCAYFEEQWDFNSDAGCNCNPCNTTLTYPDDEACSTYEPKNKVIIEKLKKKHTR